MNALNIIMPIFIGAVIGYGTNYVAIKMLFRPKKEIKLKGITVPFTPGIIPKNQKRIARAVAQAVSKELLTDEDLLKSVKQSNIKETISNEINSILFSEDKSIKSIVSEYAGEEKSEELNRKVSLIVSERIIEGAKKIDMEQVLTKLLSTSLSDIMANPVIAMFVKPQMISGIGEKLGNAWREYLEHHGKELIWPMAYEEVKNFTEKSLNENMSSLDINEEMVKQIVEDIFDKIIDKKGMALLQGIDIAAVIEEKINGMEVGKLEELVMSVMKNELQAVVNLGALLGALLGIVNIFF